MLMLCTALFAQNFGSIIRDQPEGTLHEGYGIAKGYTEFWYNLIPYEMDGVASKYVVTDDDFVYLYNPVSNYNSKSWLKGTLDKETGEVTFLLPQLINAEVAFDGEGEYEDYILACKMVYSEDAKTYVAAPGDQELKFQLENGVLTMLDDQFVGISNVNGEWYGIGETAKTVMPMTDQAVKPANEEDAMECMMNYQSKDNEDFSRPVAVKVEDSNIYVKGLVKNNPNAWVKGEIQGNKATFASRQYLGIDEEYTAHSYFMAIDEEKNIKDVATFDYTADPLNLTTKDIITTNFGKNNVMTLDYYKAPTIKDGQYVVAAPVAPTIKDCTPEDGEYSWFTITLSAKTPDGKDLDVEKLYYNIYFDDKPFTFTTSPYSTFEEDMTDIPYGFDDQNYHITKQGNDRIIYIYKKNFQKLTIQSFYLDGETKLFSKKSVWPEQEQTMTPVAPVIKDCTPDDGEYSWFTITLSAKTKDGEDLDAKKLYYNIYFDDQPFTFTTSPYSTFDKDMTDIPYGFDDGNYYITKQGDDRIVYIYKKDFQKLGIQSFYLDGETKLFSDMAVWPEQEQPKAEAPVAPVIKDCTPDGDEYSWFTITIPAKTKDGEDLDESKLFYNIYFDDQKFTFTESPYATFGKDVTDVPYNFDDDYYITRQGDDRIVYVYKKDFTKLGVECFYLDGDNKLVTERAEWNAPTDGIEEITSNDSRNTTWKDLSGRSVKNPSNGIFFRVMKKAEGSTKVIKQVVK